MEDTGRPELRDLEKVRESIEMARSNGVNVVAGVVHYSRSDTMFNKAVLGEARRKPPVLAVNCHAGLCRLLSRLLGCVC